MKPFVIYIVEFFLCSGLFMLLYRLLIVRKPNYGLCRKYLIVTMLLSAIIPALNVPLYPGQTLIQSAPAPAINAEPVERQDVAEVTTASETVEEKVVAKAEALTPQLTLNEKFMYAGIAIYLLVALILLILIVRGVLLVSKLKRQADVTLKPEYHLAVSDKVETPFSFWRTIFIRTDHDETERRQIISHEASHVAHRHSIEKLLMTVLRSVFWFNPFVWKAEQRLEEVQEWQADRDALSNGYNVESYRLTIIKQLFGCNPELTSGATNSLTKIRFMKMKQKDFQGSKFLQTAATVVLTSALFLSFGCGQSTKTKIDSDAYMPDADRIIFTADGYGDQINSSANWEHGGVVESYDKYNRINEGIEIFLNNTSNSSAEANPAATIAVNGIKTAEKPNSWKLRWVDEQTNIFIDGKKSTYAKFKALKPHEYKKIYYYSSGDYEIVYVMSDVNLVYEYNYPVIIDVPNPNDPDTNIPDLINPAGFGYAENVFAYQTHSFNAAAPLAKFAIDGKLTGYKTFRQALMQIDDKEAWDLIIYRNSEAIKRFGEDVLEVVEFRSADCVCIGYFQNNEVPIVSEIKGTPASGFRINFEKKTSDYEEVAAAIAKAKAANTQKGLSTVVNISGYVPDSIYNELISKYIDTTDSDLTIVYNKFEF